MNYLDIELMGSDQVLHRLRDFKGKKVVLYFYPKDNTSGCTLEAQEFTRLQDDFMNLGYKIIGVSKDTVKSHQNFIEKQNLDLLLLSDPETRLIEAFNVYVEKSMYGRKYMGIERSTFLLDEEGQIVKEYRSVKAKEHPSSLLCDLK
ncbi:MAG: peroxiredoxin [Candidatus Izemoplasmatales bacterium]